ncbi:MAG: hypothetical protein ACK53X_04910, partial [Holosporales bacterium]
EYIGKAQQQANPSFLDTYIYTSEPSALTLAGALTAKLEEYEDVNDITDSTTASFYTNGLKPILDKFKRGKITDKEFTEKIHNTYCQLAAYKGTAEKNTK